MTEDEKFIIVASNYRLGSLGWMSSDEEPSMTRNIGLYDGLAALQWTQANIHLFGGDGNRITAMGESAGAGIIEHLLAANTQGHAMPFDQVCPHSIVSGICPLTLLGNYLFSWLSTTYQSFGGDDRAIPFVLKPDQLQRPRLSPQSRY
jgi:hypothetical protein